MRSIFIIIISALLMNSLNLKAQELNMKVTVNSDRMEGTDKSVYINLQDLLTQWVNGRKWSDVNFAVNEKIECSILLTVLEKSDNSYKSDIQIISNRPVYNSSYMTPMFNFKDNELQFEYLTGQSIEFTENNINNNLTATIAFYIYIILGLDFDSFNLGAGKSYFEKAMSIATTSQSLTTDKGWTTYGNDRNRYALALSLTEDRTASAFHKMWYNYHRKGLDEMSTNIIRGRTVIENTISNLSEIYQSRPASPILLFWADTKLNEVINIYSKSSSEEKQATYKIFSSIFPTRRSIYHSLNK